MPESVGCVAVFAHRCPERASPPRAVRPRRVRFVLGAEYALAGAIVDAGAGLMVDPLATG